MKTKHTPTPWKVEDYGERGPFVIIQDDEDAYSILEFAYDHEIDKANAAFIVRAVNCHEELVNGIDDLIKQIEHVQNVVGFDEDQQGLINQFYDYANALIKRAKGEA